MKLILNKLNLKLLLKKKNQENGIAENSFKTFYEGKLVTREMRKFIGTKYTLMINCIMNFVNVVK
jgi:hypothetical protein